MLTDLQERLIHAMIFSLRMRVTRLASHVGDCEMSLDRVHSERHTDSVKSPQRPALLTLLIAFAAFVSLGLPDAINGVAWPSVSQRFSVPTGALGWLFIGSGTGYFISAMTISHLISVMRLGTLLTASTLLVVLGVTGYSLAPHWPVFVLSAPLIGLGSGAIDAGLNAYAAHHFSVKHVNWLHACYGIGAALGPAIMTAALVHGAPYSLGYATIALLLVPLTLSFVLTRNHWREEGSPQAAPVRGFRGLAHPMVRLHAVLFFFYTGVEVAVGQWSFTLMTRIREFPEGLAGSGTTLFWVGLTVGRFALGAVAGPLGPDRLVRMSTVGVILGVLAFWQGPDWLTLPGLALTGLSLAPIYPTLMSRTPDRVGQGYAVQSIGFQAIAAMLGAVTIPALAGWAADVSSLHAVQWIIIATALTLFGLHETLLRRSPGIASI